MSVSWAWPSPEIGFATYVFKLANEQIPPSLPSVLLRPEDRRRMSEAPVLASVGYAMASVDAYGDPSLIDAWAEGLMRLASRDPFPPDRNSFFYRPVELLGLSAGARGCDLARPESLQWLRDVVTRGQHKLVTADKWSYLLTACAAYILNVAWTQRLSPDPESLSLDELALSSWISQAHRPLAESLGILSLDLGIQRQMLARAVLQPLAQLDAARTAVLYCSLRAAVLRFIESDTERHWQMSRTAQDAASLVQQVCSRFPLFARQLGLRHEKRPTIIFTDEYDVQDALHALLRLHFDDVRSEEWVPSYGGNASRTDFLLKREQIVVETKMTSKKLNQKEVANQLIIDKERYKTHPDCKTLICFVYDPEHICQNPAALEADLSSSENPMKVIVCVAPKGG